ncbi:MAG: polyprenol monophosphomannose synthase [Candidatus Omnitrophica bacterium]|nr:polyprenol monophosphomannose synthase [Candidatus Omnitrophota bacterium]
MSKIIAIIPTYNEAGNILPLLGKLFSLASNISVLIVDDSSPDGTSQIVIKLQREYPKLHLITRACRQGLGSAYIEGFKYALKKGYDIIIQMDADLSHAPREVLKMIALIERYDLVIGSRYIKGGGVYDWSYPRVLLSRWANIFSKILLRTQVYDLTSGFKCLRKNVLEEIDFQTISSRGYAFQIEMVFRALRKGFKVIEHPIIFQGRRYDKSKMSLPIVIEAFIRVLCLFFNRFSRGRNTGSNIINK